MARPTSYLPEYCEQVIELGKEGKSKAQMAAHLGICRQTLDNWCSQFPEFMDAITHARTFAQAWWEERARASLDNRNFNAALWAKSMSARFPDEYSDRSRLELTGKDGGPVETKSESNVAAEIASVLALAQQRKDTADLA